MAGSRWAQMPCLMGTCLMASTLFLAGCAPEEPQAVDASPRAVKIMTVGMGVLNAEREFPGVARAARAVDLSFRVPGNIILLPVADGQKVGEGELIGRLDPRDFESRVTSAEGTLEKARAELLAMTAGARPEDILRMEAEVRAREAENREAQARMARYEELLKGGATSQAEYDQMKAAAEVAAANLEGAVRQLEIGRKGGREEEIAAKRAQIIGLEAQLQEARHALDDTSLLAPFAGEIARVHVDLYQDIQPLKPVARLQDVTTIEIDIAISERDMAAGALENKGVSLGDLSGEVDARVVYTAIPGSEFPARITKFETEADPLAQTFTVTLAMPQPQGEPIRPGMNATVRMKRAETATRKQEAIQVPLAAVVSAPDGSKCVWVVDDAGVVKRRQIGGGELVGDRLLVTSGLEVGERIATSAVQTLIEGTRVQELGDLGNM